MSQLDQIWQEPRPEAGNPPSMETVTRPKAPASRPRRAHVQLAVLGVAVAVAASVVAWLAVRGTSHATPVPAANSGPQLVSHAQLERLAGSLDHPLYWAGAKKGYSYELTRLTGGRTYVRYLPAGVRAGDPRADYLVVGTYAQPGSFADLKRASTQKGSVSLGIPGDGLAIFSPAKPTSVYFGYPGKGYQVEVYSPSGQTARSLVLAGKITPVR
jgi:hypothetical protein